MKLRSLIAVILFSTTAFTQNVGIGTTTPGFPLNFANITGDKISLYGNTGSHFGFGIQSSLLQIHTDGAASNIAFGYGSSNSFTERMRILNNQGYDGMILNGRLVLKNGSADLVGGGAGVWLYKPDNSSLLGFMGAQNNQSMGFYGGPGGWGFTYDANTSFIGIGNNIPNAPLSFANALGKKITLYHGSQGDVGLGVYNNELRVHTDYDLADITFGYKNNADIFTERMRIKGNGNVGIGNNNPNAPLAFPPALGKKITLYPGATGDVGFAVAGNRLQIYSDNPNADVAIGYDAAGTFNERFAVKPNGALAVNGNTGTAGQVLQSNGNAATATWGAASNWLFNNTNQMLQSTVITVNSGTTSAPLPGMDYSNYSITVPGPSKLIYSYKSYIESVICDFCPSSFAVINVRVSKNGLPYSNTLGQAQITNGYNITFSDGIEMMTVPAGTYTFSVVVTNNGVPNIRIFLAKLFIVAIPQ